MAYPTDLDTFDRPVSGVDSQDNPDSATLANDHSTAIEALQVKLGTGLSPAAAADAGQVIKADGAGAAAWDDNTAAGVSFDATGLIVVTGTTTVQAALAALTNRNAERVVDHGAAGADEALDTGVAGHLLTLDADCAVTFTGTPGAGAMRQVTVQTVQDGTGGWTPTWSDVDEWDGGVVPTVSPAAGAKDVWVFVTFDNGATWIGAQSMAGVA